MFKLSRIQGFLKEALKFNLTFSFGCLLNKNKPVYDVLTVNKTEFKYKLIYIQIWTNNIKIK